MWWIQIPKKILNKNLFNFLIKQTTYIYARDFETVDELKKYWYKNTEFFMDTAYFAYDWELTTKNKQVKYIVVNINKNGEKFLDEILEDLNHYAKKWYHIYYAPVSKWSNPEYNDTKYYNILSRSLNLEILDWENDFKTFVEVIKWAEIVVSTRLHLFLIASFLGVKTKVYPYQKKIIKMQEVLKKKL